MQLPDSVKSVRARYIAAFPIPQGSPGEGFEETARQWSIKFAEQVAFERPGEGWGMKRADPGRPISKDTIARQMDGRLHIWDLLTGTGTGAPRLNDNPESEDVTGQTFVPVAPTNHLGGDHHNDRDDEHGHEAPADLSDIRAALTRIEAAQSRLEAAQASLSTAIAAQATLGAAIARVAAEQERQKTVLTELQARAPFKLPVALVGRLGTNIRLTWEE
jgi:hypothetical protein